MELRTIKKVRSRREHDMFDYGGYITMDSLVNQQLNGVSKEFSKESIESLCTI